MGIGEELLKLFKKDGGKSKLEVVEFAPIANETVTITTVRMIASVGGKFKPSPGPDGERWCLEGGKEYQVSSALADHLIVNGWAVGRLSRPYSADEVAEIRSKNQHISLGPQEGVTRG